MRLGRELGRVDDYARRHQEQVRRAADAEALRDGTELDAGETWSRWHAEASALAAQHEAIDLSIEQAQAQAELTQARQAEVRASRDWNEANQAVSKLGPRVGAAREASQRAAEDVGRPVRAGTIQVKLAALDAALRSSRPSEGWSPSWRS